MDAFKSEIRFIFSISIEQQTPGRANKNNAFSKEKLVNAKAFGPVTTRLFLNIHLFQRNESLSQKLNSVLPF